MKNQGKNRQEQASQDASQGWRRFTNWKRRPSQAAEPDPRSPLKSSSHQPQPAYDSHCGSLDIFGRLTNESRSNTFADSDQAWSNQPTATNKADTFDSLERRDCKSSSSSTSSRDDSMNSRRFEGLQLNDGRRLPAGQKRARAEESADGDRRFKHSKSPETPNHAPNHAPNEAVAARFDLSANHMRSQANQMSSANDTLRNTKLGQSSSVNVQGPVTSSLAHRGLDLHDRSERQDRSQSPPEAGIGGDDDPPPEGDTSMLLEPDTRPITSEQLVNEVKGIYSGLVMVEKKCVEIITQRAQARTKLSNDQWQALIALHRTLLHEHHDFFVCCR
jgi:hypothetical protein